MSEEKKEKDFREDLQEEMTEDMAEELKDTKDEEGCLQEEAQETGEACEEEILHEEAEPEQETDQSDKSEKSEKKGFFKKDKKPDKKDVLIEELTDKYKRTLAEFENFRKRSEKEKSAMFEVGAKDIIEKILPVVDNFERGMATVLPEEKDSPFVDGMDKIYKQLLKVLEDAGVSPIEAVGQEFDPNLHNAVMHIEDETLGDNVVAEELQKGYMYHDSVVRHSMVKVAN